MNRRLDLAGSIGFAMLALVVLGVVATYPPRPRILDVLGPMAFPAAMGVALLVLSSVQGFRAYKAIRSGVIIDREEGTEDTEGYPSSVWRAIGFMIGSFAYILLLPMLGFLIATPITVAAGLYALNYRSPRKIILVSLMFTIGIFALFDSILSVPLPVGPLRGPLADLGIIGRFR